MPDRENRQSKSVKRITAVLLILLLIISMVACSHKQEEASTDDTDTSTKTEVDAVTDSGTDKDKDADKSDENNDESKSDETESDEPKNIVTTIADIDTENMRDLPLQMESIVLYDDGSIKIVPTENLKKNAEDNNELVDGAIYPFEDSGKATEVYLVKYGNAGYRTVLAIMDDGTLSVMNSRALIEDHIAVVADNMCGRDNFASIEQTQDEDGYGVIGKTTTGEEVDVDFSLNF